jgi:hypothetical protein
MTIRQVLSRRMVIWLLVALASWIGCAASLSFSTSSQYPPWFYAFFIVVFGIALLGFYRLKCPRCRTALGTNAFRIVGIGSGLSKRIEYCPYCGVSLDETYDMAK